MTSFLQNSFLELSSCSASPSLMCTQITWRHYNMGLIDYDSMSLRWGLGVCIATSSQMMPTLLIHRSHFEQCVFCLLLGDSIFAFIFTQSLTISVLIHTQHQIKGLQCSSVNLWIDPLLFLYHRLYLHHHVKLLV